MKRVRNASNRNDLVVLRRSDNKFTYVSIPALCCWKKDGEQLIKINDSGSKSREEI